MRSKRFEIWLALAFVLAVVIPALAITWGEPDNGEHPHVGTLTIRPGRSGLLLLHGYDDRAPCHVDGGTLCRRRKRRAQ
jgi:hypothetical protein